jgi:hypothetical protein
MAVQPFSAPFHPSLACPVRWPRPLGSPNELPAVEFSAAILPRSCRKGDLGAPMRTTSQPRALLFPSKPISFPWRREPADYRPGAPPSSPNSARRELASGPSRFTAGNANAIPSRGCNDAALLHRLDPPTQGWEVEASGDIISLVAGLQSAPTKPRAGVPGQRTGIIQCPACRCPRRRRPIVMC